MDFLESIFGEGFSQEIERIKQNITKVSVLSIIFVNLIPIFGAVLFGWGLIDVLLLYWTESAAIGFYMLLKIAVFMWKADPDTQKMGLMGKITAIIFMLAFFTIHFGGFMFGHLLFITAIFLPLEMEQAVATESLLGFDITALLAPILLGTLAFFISHGYSFVNNYLIGKEYKKTDMGKLTLAPYARIVIMQVAIIMGVFLTFWMIPLGIPPVGPILIIIVAKTVSDIIGHLREHSNLA